MKNSKYYIRVANGKPVPMTLTERQSKPVGNGWVEVPLTALGACCAFNPPYLQAPANFAAVNGGTPATQTALSWAAVSGADAYKVERTVAADTAFTGTLTTVYNSTGTSVTDTGLTTATGYRYRISAVSTGRDLLTSSYSYATHTTA